MFTVNCLLLLIQIIVFYSSFSSSSLPMEANVFSSSVCFPLVALLLLLFWQIKSTRNRKHQIPLRALPSCSLQEFFSASNFANWVNNDRIVSFILNFIPREYVHFHFPFMWARNSNCVCAVCMCTDPSLVMPNYYFHYEMKTIRRKQMLLTVFGVMIHWLSFGRFLCYFYQSSRF